MAAGDQLLVTMVANDWLLENGHCQPLVVGSLTTNNGDREFQGQIINFWFPHIPEILGVINFCYTIMK